MSSEPKLILEVEVEGFNAEGIMDFIRSEEEAGEPPYAVSDYLFDQGASPEVALGWTAPEADNQRTIVAFNARIVSYEPVTVMEFDVGGEWVRYVPATEIQGWLYDRMKVFQALGDSHAASVLMETADQHFAAKQDEESTDA